MRIASIADVKARFSAYVKASTEGPVVITRNGKPVAVLLSITNEDEIERLLLAHSPKFQQILQMAEQQIREGSGQYHAQFWQEMEAESPPLD